MDLFQTGSGVLYLNVSAFIESISNMENMGGWDYFRFSDLDFRFCYFRWFLPDKMQQTFKQVKDNAETTPKVFFFNLVLHCIYSTTLSVVISLVLFV